MSNLFIYSSLIASLICLLLSFLVYAKNKTRLPNKSFALLLLSISIWTLFPYAAGIIKDEKYALLAARFVYLAAVFTPANFLWAISIILGIEKKPTSRRIILTAYSLSFILAPFCFSSLLIKGLNRFKPNFYVQPGLLYFVFILFFALACIYTFTNLYLGIKHNTGLKRNQLKYVFTGFIIAFVGGIMHVFAPYINIEFVPHDIFIVTFALVITYAIVAFRLMDINIAIRKVISNLIISIILGAIVISAFLLPMRFIFKAAIIFILSLCTGMYLPIVKFKLEGFINQILYGSKYNYQETLVEISDTVPTIIDLDKLLKFITDKVCESMRIAKGAVLLKEDIGDKYSVHYHRGFDGENVSYINLEANGPLVSTIKDTEDVLVRHEMVQVLEKRSYNELCVDLDKFDAEVVVPIKKGDNLIGLLTLSDKAGGDTFGPDDFRLLHIIAIQAAVAVENIRLYNKLIHTDRQTFLETLASGVSHEMRNRLVAIRTFIDLFPERVNPENVEKGYLDFRELAAREMERLTKIIDSLLSYSRATTIGGEKLSVNSLLEEALLIIEPKLKENEIMLIKNLDQNVSTIKGDKGRLLQVFINIMQNGIEAMNNGGQLSVVSKNKDRKFEIVISDNGKGIAKEHLDAIFEPFFTTKHNGTGLGLSIVQRIVRDHNGRIRALSKPGKGTTFIITFSKGAVYRPTEVKPKEELSYWQVKKEQEESG